MNGKEKICSLMLGGWFAAQAAQAGTWTPLANQAPDSINTMLLLSDGTIMCANGSKAWYRLTPDNQGSYVHGTWSALAPMNDTRLYFASDVLPDGRVFVAGGEFGTGISSAEVYDPLLDNWSFCTGSGQLFSDAVSVVISNGDVLIAPTWPSKYGTTAVYHPSSNSWTVGIPMVRGFDQDEASWVKLPDDSILTDDPYGLSATNSERFIPSLNQWVNDSSIPVSLYNSGDELGAAFLLPSGKAFFIGAGGHTAIYTPTGSTLPGTWVAGPDIPNSQVAPDAPAAMMVNGKILCALDSTNGSPTTFYEYDPVANSFAQVSGPSAITNTLEPYYTRMLDLPDGTVLFSDSGQQLYVYNPESSALTQAQPAIISISTNAYRSYHLTGTRLNGISQGAAYGDDAQMDSNYPIVRMTNSSGDVYYARTYNWSSTSVMNTNPTTVQFLVPAGLPAGTYSLFVVANGVSSAPYSFTFTPDALQIQPLNGFAAVGPTNGPFGPSSMVYTLTNAGGVPLNWAVASTSLWLNVSRSSGTLLPGGASTNIVISLASNATSLAVGAYSATVVFTNLANAAVQSVRFGLQVNPLVQNGGFETGSFGFWTLSGDTSGSTVGNTGDYSSENGIQDTQYIHSGFYGALLGNSSNLGYLSQEVPTTPGGFYLLSFWLDNPLASPRNQFFASWNGTNLVAGTNMLAFTFTNFQFIVSASGSNTSLNFGSYNGTNYFGLDDISVTPVQSPVFLSENLTNRTLSLHWSATPGLGYQLQYSTDLRSNHWTNLGSRITASTATLSGTDAATNHSRFYRLLMVP